MRSLTNFGHVVYKQCSGKVPTILPPSSRSAKIEGLVPRGGLGMNWDRLRSLTIVFPSGHPQLHYGFTYSKCLGVYIIGESLSGICPGEASAGKSLILHPKWHPIPDIVHFFVRNRAPFWTQPDPFLVGAQGEVV